MKRKIICGLRALALSLCLCLSVPGISALAADEWRWSKQQQLWLYGEHYTGWVHSGQDWYYVEDSVMATGWRYIDGHFYFMYPDGHMASNSWVGVFYTGADGAVVQGAETPDGREVDANGILMKQGRPVREPAPYLSLLKANPGARLSFGEGNDGQYRISIENGSYVYKALNVYIKGEDGTEKLVYSGDGFIELAARLKLAGMEHTERFGSFYLHTPRFAPAAAQFDPAGHFAYFE